MQEAIASSSAFLAQCSLPSIYPLMKATNIYLLKIFIINIKIKFILRIPQIKILIYFRKFKILVKNNIVTMTKINIVTNLYHPQCLTLLICLLLLFLLGV